MEGTEEPLSWIAAFALIFGIGALVAASGWLVIEVARRAADGRLGPNGWAGTRTRSTRSSPEAWQAAHLAGLAPSLLSGRIFIASALVGVAGMVSGDPETAVAIWGVVIGVGVLVATAVLLYGAWLAQKTAKRYIEDRPS